MEKIDLVYILKAGASKWRNREFRYSLRSVYRNFPALGKVFLIGACPKWINTDRIVYVPATDPYTNKLKNAIHKLRIACRDNRIGDKFVLMNDDFYFLKRIDEIMMCHKGTLKRSKEMHETQGGYYFKAISKTLEKLESMGIKDPLNYEMHFPMILEKDKFLRIIDSVDWMSTGYLFRSIYCNILGIKGKYRKDVKIEDVKELEQHKGSDFLSTNDAVVMDKKFQKWIMGKFHTEAPYEKRTRDVLYVESGFTYKGRTYNPGDIVKEDLPERLIKKAHIRVDKKRFS